MLIACLVAESMQHWFLSFADPLWPCITVKVIKMRMSIYEVHKSAVMPSLNVIAYIWYYLRYCKLKVVKFEAHLHTHTHTHRLGSSISKFASVAYDFANNKVSPTSFCQERYQWNGNIVSFYIWERKRDTKIMSSSGLQKLAWKAGTDWPDSVHMSYMRRSCDHNSRRRVLMVSNWTRTYHGLPLQQV